MDDLAHAGKEYFDEVVELYEGESKRFRTVLSGVLTFGLLFFFLVLLPFVRLHHQHRVIGARLQELGAESDRVAAAVRAYGEAADGFKRLREEVVRGHLDLRDALPRLLSAGPPQQMAQQSLQQAGSDPCRAFPDRSEWANCRVAGHVKSQFERYRRLLDASVVAPLKTLLDVTALPVGLDSLQAAFEARLADNPDFWERFDEKSEFFHRVRDSLDEFWKRYGFEERRMAVDSERIRLDSLTGWLKQRQAALDTGEQKLAARLTDLDSPLGKLPVGLVEGVQIFPLLMAVGFGWCVFVLRRLVTLRRAVREGSAQRDLAELTDRHLTLVAPLWVDRGHPAFAHTLLLAPIAIFIASCALVAYHWSLGPEAHEVLAMDPWVYGGLYAATAVGLYVMARRGAAAVRALRDAGS